MDDVSCLIDGKDVEAPSAFEVLDPSTGRVLARVARGGAEQVDAAVRAARAASPGWRRTSPADRGAALRRLGELVARDREELALLESRDTGKPLTQARADADVAARYFSFYASAVETFTGDTLPTGPDLFAFTRPVPFGVTGHIIPWNYPMQIACRTLAPALAVGNCAVVKPAEEAPLTVLRIGRLAAEAGLPPGVLNVVPGLGEEAGAALARHAGIDHLSFTGSVQVGVEVTRAAAEHVVPVALELGGKSPNVVLPDADVEAALPVIAKSILQNAGQTCSAGSRLLVHEAVHAEVVDGLARVLGDVRIGPGPADPDLGPLISERQLARVEEMVTQASRTSQLRLGSAQRHTGAGPGGFYFAPVIADDVAPGDAIAQEEVFGPVVAVSTFADVDEAVSLANGTEYGLIAAVWTSDVNLAHRLTDEIHAGQVYVNTYGAGGGVEFPFGGFKKSGYGREKGAEALRAFCQTKTVVLKVTA
jgi:aldehyde dehydrogenase (NAD+)/betaine-aldehyde dehydrogenase